jgi:hypothetical protein
MTTDKEPILKRSRPVIRPGAAIVPDINDVIIKDDSPEKPLQPEAGQVKKATKTKKRIETAEPYRNPRRNFEEDNDVPEINLRELFELKETRKNDSGKESEKSACAQGVAVGDLDMPYIGIAFPSFCLEMFTGHSVLPLSSCYVLAGPTSSFKSHLALEIARWVSGVGGAILLAENETKYIRDMAHAVMGRTRGKHVWTCKCKTFNQVQNALINGIKRRDAFKTNVPMMQIVDSIVGNTTESSQKKLKDKGEVERGYQANALAASNFLPGYLPMLAEKPYLGLWVTHVRDVREVCGPYEKVTTTLKGGGTWEYRCCMALILRRISEKPKYTDKTWMVRLKLQLKKDAGVQTFQLPFNVRCVHDVVLDTERDEYFSERKVRFCWDEATINLWLKPETAGYPPFYKTAVQDVTGFQQVKISGKNYFIAPKIGIGKNEATRDCTQIVDALYDSPNILDRLRAELGIQKGIVMPKGGVFDDLTEQARAVAIRRASLMKSKKSITYIRHTEIAQNDYTASKTD